MHNTVLYNDYYEAIIQVRPDNKKLTEFLKKFLITKKCTIAKEINKNYGIDYYVSSKRIIRPLQREVKKRFKCSTIISTKLHTRHRLTSKKVYRVTLLIRT